MLQYIQKHHPKYFLIGHRLLSALHGALSKRLQHVLRWNRTVNPNGGRGKNIAMDLQMEFFNKEYKGMFNDLLHCIVIPSVISSPITLERQKWKSSKMKGILLSSPVSC
jgi:hypothetical protein